MYIKTFKYLLFTLSEIYNLISEDGAMHIITIEQWYCVVLTTTTDDQIVR